MPRTTLFSGFRFSHHNSGSGYDACVPEGAAYVCGNVLPLGGWPETTFARHVNFLLVDLLTLLRARGKDTVHYFYPENTAYVSPWLLRRLGKRIVYTLHLSEQVWLAPMSSPFMRLKQWSLRSSDVLVTLSREQQALYAQHFPDKDVRFVPHGIHFDAHSDLPLELFAERLRDPSLTVVGHNYRDFDMLERIVKTRATRNVTFHLVGMNEEVRARFTGYEYVTSHPRLTPEAYAQVLRSSLALLLPLSFATANNAILEAYRDGLPVFASRIPGVTDYADDSFGGLFESEDEFWTRYDALIQLSAEQLRVLALSARQSAGARFAWPAIQRKLGALY